MAANSLSANYLSINEVEAGTAVFHPNMPVWLAEFGDDVWSFTSEESPLYEGRSTSSIVWSSYVNGKESDFSHSHSFAKGRYAIKLTPEIVEDLKIAAVIHGYFPRLINRSKSTKAQLDPRTVKGRIDELVKFFSMVLSEVWTDYGIRVEKLSEIPFSTIKTAIAKYPGRHEHLKRALKLISEPMVQKNLSSPLQWTLLDIIKSNLVWNQSIKPVGIQTLSDTQFIFLLNHCKRSIATLKRVLGLDIYDSDCAPLADRQVITRPDRYRQAIEDYFSVESSKRASVRFRRKHGISLGETMSVVTEAHRSAMMIILLLTGMRLSESKFLRTASLVEEPGYWFLRSKVTKGRPKDAPCVEGWLAVDLTRDANDILEFICSKTGSDYLFSSPYPGLVKNALGYRGNTLNSNFIRWLKQIDTDNLFSEYKFSVHQCRETLVYQLAKQEVGMPFLSMQLKHVQRQLNTLPNEVTAGYGKYRSRMLASIASRIAGAREVALLDLYGENARFAGGAGERHKARIDTFFTGLGLYGEERDKYIRAMARHGVKAMPTSIGSCTKNFMPASASKVPPCYGDYQCDPNCENHVITERGVNVLKARRDHAIAECSNEPDAPLKVIWLGLAEKLDGHIRKLNGANPDAG